jgi:hypothetical protein
VAARRPSASCSAVASVASCANCPSTYYQYWHHPFHSRRAAGDRDARWRAGGIRGEPLRGWPSKEGAPSKEVAAARFEDGRLPPLLDSRVGDPRAGFEEAAAGLAVEGSAPSKEVVAARFEDGAEPAVA